MHLDSDESQELINRFLDTWPIERINKMSLQEYVTVGDPDTYTQWLDTKTNDLGSIRGFPSIKFGIYERKNKDKEHVRIRRGDKYSWEPKFGDTEDEAFIKIRGLIVSVAKAAMSGKFNLIDSIDLHSWVKWKIAYLYSNGRIIPIFEFDVLYKIAADYKVVLKRDKLSIVQELMIRNKPSGEDIFSYAYRLWIKYSGKNQDKRKGKKRRRKGVTDLSPAKPQKRKYKFPNVIAKQIHKLLQTALRDQLRKKFPDANIIFEKNYIDLMVELDDRILLYEVKSMAYAEDCIVAGIGQLLNYTYQNNFHGKNVELFIVGQYKPNPDELPLIKFIKKQIALPFEYINVELP